MRINERFRGFLPVVIDLETGGFDDSRHALLQVAVVFLHWDRDRLVRAATHEWQVAPEPGLAIEEASLAVTGIDLDDPTRNAVAEELAIRECFRTVRRATKEANCQRAILTAHNAHFDLGFLTAAAARHDIKRNPFHPFSVMDTVGLAAVAYGHTVLSEACDRAGVAFDAARAHSATHDAEVAAELFCKIVNTCPTLAR